MRNNIAIVFLLVSTVSWAQSSSYTTNPSASVTPVAVTPASALEPYGLSSFESISAYNGQLSVAFPLLKVGGRGEAGYTITGNASLPPWTLDLTNSVYPQQVGDLVNLGYRTLLQSQFWYKGYKVGYGAGLMLKKSVLGGPVVTICVSGELVMTTSFSYLVFLDSVGAEHAFYDPTSIPGPGNYSLQCGGGRNRGKRFLAVDGSGMVFNATHDVVDDYLAQSANYDPVPVDGTLVTRTGVKYSIVNGMVQKIEDRNGNYVQINPVAGTNQPATITDSLGRQVTIAYDQLPGQAETYDLITYKGANQTDRQIRVYRTSVANKLRNDYSSSTALFANLDSTVKVNGQTAISKVQFPNSKTYELFYTSYGEVARILLPTGAVVEYEHGAGLQNAGSVSGTYATGQVDDSINNCGYNNLRPEDVANTTPAWVPYVYRRLVSRRVYLGGAPSTPLGGSPNLLTTYSRQEIASAVAGTGFCPSGTYGASVAGGGYVDVSDTGDALSSALTVRRFFYNQEGGGQSTVTGGPANQLGQVSIPGIQPDVAPKVFLGKEYRTETGGLLAQERLFARLGDGSAAACQENSIWLDTNQTIGNQFAYNGYGNRTDLYELDYGSAAAITGQTFPFSTPVSCPASPTSYTRRTHTDYKTDPAYVADGVHLISLPTAHKIYGADQTIKAATTYEYDIYTPDTNHAALTTYTAIPQWDTTFTASVTVRGNVTQVSRQKDSSGNTVNSYQQYDVLGNVVKKIDGNGNPTNIEYGSTYAYALSTKVTDALNKVSQTAYDLNVGKPSSFTDANAVTTTYSYNDLLDRPTQVVRAAGITAVQGQTTFTYDDTNRIVTTTGDQNLYGDNALKTQMVYDGLGRPIESRTFETAVCYIRTTRSYDALGRVSKVSNPFRPCNFDTAQLTTTGYDALGRVTSVTTPDNAVVSSLYSGNQVTVTDQAGKSRRSESDALGRLTKVTEAPGVAGFGLESSYAYDALDNLTAVTQGVQSRSFVYDSLSRLTSATNPENGPINYTYDNNGNVTTKTDARGETTCYGTLFSTQCLQTGYDELNRLIRKTYSDGTPTVFFDYDLDLRQAGDTNANYPVGRLSQTNSNGVSTTTYHRYDPLGRVAVSSQSTGGQTYSFSYGYDLAGELKTESYPSGRLVSNNYDAVGRLSSISGYASSFVYAPHGAIQLFRLGNGLYEHTSFNNRLQPTVIGLGTSGTNSSVLGLGYDYGTTNNNGNLLNQIITAPPGLSLSQTYSYDPVNRLDGASETQPGLVWWQNYLYDRYGNQWVSGTNLPLTGLTPSDASWFVPTAGQNPGCPVVSGNPVPCNRIVGNGYDATGNQMRAFGAPGSFTYDAENRQKQVTLDAPASGVFTYGYDGNGQRVTRSLYGMNNVYVYDVAGQLKAEYRNGALLKEFVHLGGKLLAVENASQGREYLTTDHLGSTRVVTDANGNVKSRHDYLPFGKEVPVDLGGRNAIPGYAQGGTTFQPTDERVLQRFTGKELDPETGLDYFGARYYSGRQGRFTSPDEFSGGIVDPFTGRQVGQPGPLPYADITDPQTLNKYAYVRNNPLRYTDPDGHMDDDDDPADRVLVAATTTFGGMIGMYLGGAVGGGTGLVAAGVGAIPGAAAGATAGGAAGAGLGYALGKGIVFFSRMVRGPEKEDQNTSSEETNNYGPKGKPDHQAKVEELGGKARQEAKLGEQVLRERKVQKIDSGRRPDQQIVNRAGKTRKVFEAERQPTWKRNLLREKEYRKLKLDQETHKVP